MCIMLDVGSGKVFNLLLGWSNSRLSLNINPIDDRKN